jgi:micrococcal nuclease
MAPPEAAASPIADNPSEPPVAGPGPAEAKGPSGATQRARVVSITDGDTIRVRIDGDEYRVRYIGMDAPERGDDPIAGDATRANRRLVDDERVWLERDVSSTDRFDRLLRHVWIKRDADWLLVGAELVRRGLASAKSYPPDVRYDDLLWEAQLEAQSASVGLWASTPSTPAPPPGFLDPPAQTDGCDPAYPGVCIPSAPPDLDCGDISYRRFEVQAPDPHNFDGDFDGIGCESG